MSIPLVGWSNKTMSVSSSKCEATFKRLFSETVSRPTRVCRTGSNPRSVMRASICLTSITRKKTNENMLRWIRIKTTVRQRIVHSQIKGEYTTKNIELSINSKCVVYLTNLGRTNKGTESIRRLNTVWYTENIHVCELCQDGCITRKLNRYIEIGRIKRKKTFFFLNVCLKCSRYSRWMLDWTRIRVNIAQAYPH